jgi:hypothetical protein
MEKRQTMGKLYIKKTDPQCIWPYPVTSRVNRMEYITVPYWRRKLAVEKSCSRKMADKL